MDSLSKMPAVCNTCLRQQQLFGNILASVDVAMIMLWVYKQP